MTLLASAERFQCECGRNALGTRPFQEVTNRTIALGVYLVRAGGELPIFDPAESPLGDQPLGGASP